MPMSVRLSLCLVISGFIARTVTAMTSIPPLPTSGPPEINCLTEPGDVLQPGQSKMYGGGLSCFDCFCDPQNGLQCYYGDCRSPPCVDYTLPPGDCCYICPNGPNCKVPGTTTIISAGQVTTLQGGRQCQCPPAPDGSSLGWIRPEDTVAVCTQTTTTPTTTTTTTTITTTTTTTTTTPTPQDVSEEESSDSDRSGPKASSSCPPGRPGKNCRRQIKTKTKAKSTPVKRARGGKRNE